MTRRTKPPTAIYSALADATRCRIVEILLAGPIPVHTLADAFSISRPAISRHLRVLKTAGLVAEVKKGRENLYALRTGRISGAINWLEAVLTPGSPAGQPSKAPIVLPEASATAPQSVGARPNPPRAPEQAAIAVQDDPPLAVSVKAGRPQRVNADAPVNQMGFDF